MEWKSSSKSGPKNINKEENNNWWKIIKSDWKNGPKIDR